MKLVEVAANNKYAGTQAQIIEYIDRASKLFGVESLYGGNCGMFAKSMLECINAPNMYYAVLFRDVSVAIEDERELLEVETDIYHIVVEFLGKFYDGSGEISPSSLLDFAYSEYKDDSPGFLHEIKPSKIIDSIITNDTNWSISAEYFKKQMAV